MKCPVCKNDIPESVLRCPNCNARTGIICSNCNTVNSVSSLTCKSCGSELLKICSHCGSVNFPKAEKCRKCATPFDVVRNGQEANSLGYKPKLMDSNKAFELLFDGIHSKDKKIFSITGEKGIGKTSLLKRIISDEDCKNFKWCIGKCTQLTQLTPGGILQDMLLNIFRLPNYCTNTEDINSNAIKFFGNEFKFLDNSEIGDLINFIYNSKEGHYEDIIINKKRMYNILYKIFDALCATGKFIFVVDNFDFIDGFSIEFFTNFVDKKDNWKHLKFIVIYNEHKPVSGIFSPVLSSIKNFVDIHLAPVSISKLEQNMKSSGDAGTYVSKREKEVILSKCKGNPAFVEQAVSYCFDCQIADKAFIVPKTFSELVKDRLETLKKINKKAFRLLCGAAILGDKLYLALLREIFSYKIQEFNDVISYLVKTNFVRPNNEIFYEFNSIFLWENILKNIQNDDTFEEINIKIGKALSVYNLNTNAVMAIIAHNLKENRMAFDIWTKTTRMASFVGDINLYVIAQKQCLALLNEFNENETISIRYNISERLGKLLTEYDPQEAIEYLPDAISHAKAESNQTKEIELLSYLSLCCKKTGNYFGDVECVDSVLKHLNKNQVLERAMIISSKIPSLIKIGNCGEVINLIENDILPVLTAYLQKPKLSTTINLGLVYETRIYIQLYLAQALAQQGNERCFEVLSTLFDIIEKNKISDNELFGRAKLVYALANTMTGKFQLSVDTLSNVATLWGLSDIEADSCSSVMCEHINNYNLIFAINKLFLKDYADLREDLFEWAMFAQNSGNEFHQNILKVFLGKVFYDSKQAKKALEIYNKEITYFADKKLAFGALLCWYLIAQATMVVGSLKSAVDIAQRALDIAQNPKINNLFFIVLLKNLLAHAYLKQSDYETAKVNLEFALAVSKKYGMYDLLSKTYLAYGKYYYELGMMNSQNQLEYLKGASKMFDNALDVITNKTRSVYMKDLVAKYSNNLLLYCQDNGFSI